MAEPTLTKTCSDCGTTKDRSEFPQAKPGHYRKRCRPCQNASRTEWRAANRDRIREYFQITRAEYAEMFEAQGGVCAICASPETAVRSGQLLPLAVDHDHSCCERKPCRDCRRDLLCGRCNRAIGLLRDNPDLIDAAAAYLRRWGK